MENFISICIPAYKRTSLLKRLLDSIVVQTFKDFEVIVTDDSPDNSVQEVCESYNARVPIKYFKNLNPLGTPENWNESIRRATGEWIKIMHDDDWFSSPDSLSKFASKAQEAGDNSLLFCAFTNVPTTGKSRTVEIDPWHFWLLKKSPLNLLANNSIGPPSNTLFKHHIGQSFDKNLKWLVDLEFYIRILRFSKLVYIAEPLVNIGIHGEQVTVSASLNPEVEIFEHLYLTRETGPQSFQHIMFFDAWWRLLRNLKVRQLSYLESFSRGLPIPRQVTKMIALQRRIPPAVLNIGVASKLLMFICYIFHRK